MRSDFSSQSSFFEVDPIYQNNSMFYPLHFPADPYNDCSSDPFFVCYPNQNLPALPDAPCGSTIQGSTILGMRIANPDGAVSIASALANRQLNYQVYNEESKFEVAKSIERGLKEQSIELPDTGIYIAWKDSLYQSNAARLNAYSEEWMKEINDPFYLQLSTTWQESAKTAFDSAMTYFAEMQEAENFDTLGWTARYAEITTLQANADNLHESLKLLDENKEQAKRTAANQWNQAVSDIRDFETMERTINEIYLNSLALGEFTFTTEQLTQITEIAWQCPLKSAAAVYKARSMYEIVYPYSRFDNYSICATQGMQYRLAQGDQTQKEEEKLKELLLFPNPSSGMLNIQLTGNNNLTSYIIINSLGQQLHNWQNQEEKQLLNLFSLGLSSGVYYIQAETAIGKVYRKKFVYQKH